MFTIDFRKFGGLGKNLTSILLLITPALAFTAQDSKLACKPGNPPVWPSEARKQGVEGTVKAKILVKSGEVQDILILSGPEAFHESVKAAIRQYKCEDDGTGTEKSATQEFRFYFQKTPEAVKPYSPMRLNTVNLELISCPEPVYPPRELQDGIQGRTVVKFMVAEEGIVIASEVLVSSKNKNFDSASIMAIRNCVFKPPILNGVPVRLSRTQQYNWTIEDSKVNLTPQSLEVLLDSGDRNFKPQSLVYMPFDDFKELLTSPGFGSFHFGAFEYSGAQPICGFGNKLINKVPVEKFLQYAFNEQLRNSQKYDVKKTKIEGRILELKHRIHGDSQGRGYWEIVIELSSKNGSRVIERSRIDFETGFGGTELCNNAADKFSLLAKQLFNQIITKQQFNDFFK